MYSRRRTSMIGLLTLFFLAACRQSPDIGKEKENIQAQIDRITQAHYEQNAALFYAPYDKSWFDAREGRVQREFRDSVLLATQEYLDHMEFLDMQQTHEPIIEISDDGTMASYMGAVVLRGKLSSEPVFWVVSWQSVLKKRNGEWKIISNANTQATEAGTANMILELANKTTGQLKPESSVYALASCSGPGGDFRTLIISQDSAARMEQQGTDYHIILKNGRETSWSLEVESGKLNEEMEMATKMFVTGHELHWLSFKPEKRFDAPVFKGFEMYNNRQAFKIEFTDALNRKVYYYYSFEDYLPLGFSIATDTADARVNVYFEDWRDSNGLKVFYGATFEDGDNIFKYIYEEIKISEANTYDLDNRNPYIP